ncbi:MAG: hypothetical protein IKS45_09425, partial [Thermoguttaceae bacterium]|nr:hypothetical protein [Thermoguttaceae bacterium]
MSSNPDIHKSSTTTASIDIDKDNTDHNNDQTVNLSDSATIALKTEKTPVVTTEPTASEPSAKGAMSPDATVIRNRSEQTESHASHTASAGSLTTSKSSNANVKIIPDNIIGAHNTSSFQLG